MVDEPWEAAQAHLEEDIKDLDSLSSQEFKPALDILDAAIESLSVNAR